MARPLELDDIKTQAICNAISRGNTRRCAAALAGVSYATLCNWIKAARSGDIRFLEFLGRLEKADAAAEDGAVQVVRAGAQGWQGSAWWLERRRRMSWRRPAVEQAKAPEQDLTQVDEAELYAAVEKLRPKEKKTA